MDGIANRLCYAEGLLRKQWATAVISGSIM